MADTLQAVATDELAKSQGEQTRAAAQLTTAQTDLAQARLDVVPRASGKVVGRSALPGSGPSRAGGRGLYSH